MEQGYAGRRARVRLTKCFAHARFTTTFLTFGLLIAAMLVAACAGGGSVPGGSHQFSPQAGNCIGNPGGQAQIAGRAEPLIKGCPSPPPQWDVIVTNPGNSSLTSYQFTTSGNATPLATISGSSTGLSGNYGIWYDGDTGDFFASNATGDSVERWGIGSLDGGKGGNLAPDQTLSGTGNGLTAPYGATENYANMLPQGDEPAYTINVPTGTATPSVVAHLENANNGSYPTPLYSIVGNLTQLANGVGLAVDSNSSSPNFGGIYVDSVSGKDVLMWLPSSQFPNPTANQKINIAPYKTIGGTATGITDPIGLYVDQNGYLFVVNRGPDKVLVFSPTASGNVAPSNTISASLSSPYGVSVYSDQTVYVTNDGNNSITVYNNGDHGTSTLQRTISGSNTGLNNPASIDLRIGR